MKTLQQSTGYKMVVLAAVVIPFLGTIYGITTLVLGQMMSMLDLWLMIGFYFISALGITAGFHRMLTHRSFRAHPVIKTIFLIFGSLALEGRAIDWAATHIKHHADSDTEDDPHSPLQGFFHAHVGWLFKNRQANPEVYARHLLNDKIVMFVSNTFLLWATLGFVIPGVIGLLVTGTWAGFWSAVLWAGLVRVFLAHHTTWSVNSICHTFGWRMFETTDQSRNEPIIAILGLGEGWHNNHHAFPRSAFHGLKWYQIDIAGYVILLLEKVGLIKDVYRVSPAMMEKRYAKNAARNMNLPLSETVEAEQEEPVSVH